MNTFNAKKKYQAIKYCSLVASILFGAHTQAAVFQAEDYNEYYDTTSGNSGGTYRNDSVDIEKTLDPVGGGYNVGWIAKDEWLVYNKLSIPANGTYTVRLRVASPSGATASVDLNGGAIELGSVKIPATGGWQNWTTVSFTASIKAGTYDLGVFAQTAGWNFNWIEVTANGAVSSSSQISSIQASSIKSSTPASISSSSKSNAVSSSKSSVVISSKSSVGSSEKSSVISSKSASSVVALSSSPASSSPASSSPVSSSKASSKSSTPVSSKSSSSSSSITSIASSSTSSQIDSSGVPAGYSLVWHDEFDKNGLPDATKWDYDTEANATGWYNNEKQYYAVKNLDYSEVKDGKLIITARKVALTNEPDYGGQAYTSARLITNGKATWTYGYYETRAKLPCGKGSWPAIWMLGLGDWPASGEIDIMEQVGSNPTSIEGTIWTSAQEGTNGDGSTIKINDACSAFHNYQLTWTPESLVIAVDNKAYHTYKNSGNGPTVWPFDKPMYFLLNLALGGDMGGPIDDSIFPIKYEVEYVRIYQKK